MDLSYIFITITLLLGLISLIFFLMQRIKKLTPVSLTAKAVTSVFFILTAVSLFISKPGIYAALIIAGLVCGLLGDIWLDMKFMYRQHEKFYTNAGFISFAIGHFFYIAAIITGSNPSFKAISLLPSLAVAIIAGTIVFFGEKLLKLNYGSYKTISTLYGGLLFFVTAFSLFAAIFAGAAQNKHLITFFVGGLLFAISDLILSGTYFGEGKNRPVDIITNHVAYYFAQYIIALSIMFI